MIQKDVNVQKELIEKLQLQEHPIIYQVHHDVRELFKDRTQHRECLLLGYNADNYHFFNFDLSTDMVIIQFRAVKEHAKLLWPRFSREIGDWQCLADAEDFCTRHNYYFTMTGYEYVPHYVGFFLTKDAARKYYTENKYIFEHYKGIVERNLVDYSEWSTLFSLIKEIKTESNHSQHPIKNLQFKGVLK